MRKGKVIYFNENALRCTARRMPFLLSIKQRKGGKENMKHKSYHHLMPFRWRIRKSNVLIMMRKIRFLCSAGTTLLRKEGRYEKRQYG